MAAFLVALYAFCALAPHAALAVTHAQNAVHCFIETETSPHQHVHGAKAHMHDDGSIHSDAQAANTGTADDESGAQAACCGLFSASAVAVETPTALYVAMAGERIAALPHTDLADHPPGRLIRPPII